MTPSFPTRRTSDLEGVESGAGLGHRAARRARHAERPVEPADAVGRRIVVKALGREIDVERGFATGVAAGEQVVGAGGLVALDRRRLGVGRAVVVVAARFEQRVLLDRSEEHTSELQSLMRNSYAVFCLKKKKIKQKKDQKMKRMKLHT